jgi:hypothetical protein
MLKSIFLKEFFKIRRLWLIIFSMNLALTAYIFISTRQLFILDHPEVVWYRVLHLGQIHFENLRFAPLLSGILIACIQYLPEMREERLRLSLHLPISPHMLILAHALVGLTAFGTIALADLASLWVITALYFPKEGVITTLITAMPWIMAGVAAYLGGALTLLEPGYPRKILNFIVAAGVAGLFLQKHDPGSYAPSLFWLILILVPMTLSLLLPAYRFRYRRTN